MTGRLLLFGPGGFIGSHFRAEAAAGGFEVIGAARSPAEGDLACDLLDPSAVERVVRETSPQFVANLAGASSVAESWRDPAAALALNCLGAQHVLEACARHAPVTLVLCVSSADVYGAPEESSLPLAEDSMIRPVNPYGASKAAMEVACSFYARARETRIAVVRSFNHLGPGQSDRFAASSFARQIADAERDGARAISLRVGDLSPVRDFSDVRDAVRAYRLVLEHGLTGTYNVCSGRPVALRALIDALAEQTSLEVEVTVEEGRIRPREAPALYGSHARLTDATGWEPAIPLAMTAEDLLAWWRAGEISGA